LAGIPKHSELVEKSRRALTTETYSAIALQRHIHIKRRIGLDGQNFLIAILNLEQKPVWKVFSQSVPFIMQNSTICVAGQEIPTVVAEFEAADWTRVVADQPYKVLTGLLF
jgi:hypothetical protein